MVKFPDWIYRQSAALPYRPQSFGPGPFNPQTSHPGRSGTEILLVTSRSGRRWGLPKGIVEPGMTPQASAAKEAQEEAGIAGKISEEALGSYRRKKWGGTCRVDVFPMRVTAELAKWSEAGLRRREWLPLEAAVQRVKGKQLRRILQRLPEHLAKCEDNGSESAATAIRKPRLLFLLRHAKSSWDNPSLADFDRPLAPRGLAASKAMSAYLKMADVNPGLVLCSPAARARATLAGIRQAFGEKTVLQFDERIYHADASDLLALLHGIHDSVASVMLIGHNPAMEMLALQLGYHGDAEASARMATKFPTAALAILVVENQSWQRLAAGTCQLHSFVTPRDLA